MRAKVIKTESDYAAALSRIEKLMDAKRNTPQGDELELLTLLVHDYEEKVFPIDIPDPITAIRFRMSSAVWNLNTWFDSWAAAAAFRRSFPAGEA
jgi:HTH-type transcriptional regulator/antitoxin HigA